MAIGSSIVHQSTRHPWLVVAVITIATFAVALGAALPSIWPDRFPSLNGVRVDTDPENMLSHSEPVRVFHDQMKKALALHDMIVLGVVNETHPNGVFNPHTLANVYELTQFAKTLRGEAIGVADPGAGVVEVDLIAPSTVDSIEQGGPGTVKFEWLMPTPPATDEEAIAVRDRAARIPFLQGTMVSEDGKALALYLPVTSKDLSYRIYTRLRDHIATLEGSDEYHITGLPVAEDTFGVEMFIQMAVSAPLAMIVIFLLMLYFFRKLVLIISPMIIAMASVIITMGALVVTGNTIHIMSSMIPIFIMPIAVLDSIHILSEFFDHYQKTRNRRETIHHVMDTLYMPMLYTSLTSAAGFASLALTPIPPVQIFGMFVAMGVMLAWLLTVTFIPAYVMFIPERSLANFGMRHSEEETHKASAMDRLLAWAGEATFNRSKVIIALACVAVAIAAYGISHIQINDNPTKWFRSHHPIRVADKVLNSHFGGTYMAYLAIHPEGEAPEANEAHAEPVATQAPASEPALPAGLGGNEPTLPAGLGGAPSLPAGLDGSIAPEATPPTTAATEPEALFKNPETLRYIEALQAHLQTLPVVGKSNSIADIVKTVHRELIDGSEAAFRIPDSEGAVAQCLLQYQSSHRPQDIWHFVTPDYRATSLWLQLKSGDNKDMEAVVDDVEAYFAANPLPNGLVHEWFGLTYINVVWQDKMVSGMLQSFLGSFLVVLLMMIVLFRSALWGLLSMIPLTLTIGLIYGVIGIIGKDYDMPVAVLSSLTLGLAVDFAIHFLARARAIYAEKGNWALAHTTVFGEPARAITRNVIVIAVGFLPLLAAPLVPYNTVGIFLAAILMTSGIATLALLPAIIRVAEGALFPKSQALGVACKCGTCIATAATAIALVAVNIHQFLNIGWSSMTWLSLALLPVFAAICFVSSRRGSCAS